MAPLLAVALSGVAFAEQHIQDVLQHADDAVLSAGDAKSIGAHALDAIDVIDEAKAANASRADVLEYLERGEEELHSAVTNANRFNTNTAWQDALDAKRYLDAADQAANGQAPR